MPNDKNFLVSEFRTLELIWNLVLGIWCLSHGYHMLTSSIYFDLAHIGERAFLMYEITPLGKKRTTATSKNP